ncbi:hypothetical protein E2C01_018173 [Portunus trituberculatus]|uniref:RNase H type-1 domain-containing protein n=1 Tax=Portunus trituberculatus TaxID=210409 RepID=A0A5B7DW32_PORTR|nr:hypothetical protein [Portunus trituberculatus]
MGECLCCCLVSHRATRGPGIPGNEVADAAAKMAISVINISQLPFPISTAKRPIIRLPLRPSNIFCSTVHASTPTALHYAHAVALRLAITTLDLPTLLAVSGVYPSRQRAAFRPVCAFMRKTGQLLRL